jgi:hypothetical protein
MNDLDGNSQQEYSIRTLLGGAGFTGRGTTHNFVIPSEARNLSFSGIQSKRNSSLCSE